MRVCVLDTETNGLYRGEFEPHALQVSYMILNTKGIGRGRIIENEKDAIVRISKDTPLSEESIRIHGITRERSENEGKDIKEILEELRDEIKKNVVELLVGHNIEYDIRVLDTESRRNGWSGLFGENGLLKVSRGEGIGVYCTAKESIGICNIRMTSETGRMYLKYGRLIEVYQCLFGELDRQYGFDMTNYEKYLHDSRMDVLVCARIYIMLSYSVDMSKEWMNELQRYNLRRSPRLAELGLSRT